MKGSTFDYLIILSYLIGVALIGIFSGGKQKSIKDYFQGSKSVPWWAVCFSIVAAETSTLTFISIPGLAYVANLNFLQVTFGYLLGRIIIAFVFLPAYEKGELKTAYTFLENRFGGKTRSFASIVFLFTRIAADGVRLFATAIPLKLMLDISYPTAIAIIAFIALVYTYTGGVKGIIWVDVLQMFIYIIGAIISGIYLLNLIPGGWETVVTTAAKSNKFSIFNLGFDKGFSGFFSQPYTLIGGLIGGAFLSMASHGTDQLIVQRLLSTKSLKDSKKAIITSGIIVIMQFAIFLVVGVLLYVYYGQLDIKSDAVFPKFIIEVLPSGLFGFIIAGLLAAALSTLAGSISSLSSSSMMDLFLPFFGKNINENKQLTISRYFSIFWAFVLVGVAIFFMNTSQAVVELALSIASFTYGGLLGTFLLGILVKNAKQEDALAGFVAGIFVMISIISLKLVAWTWFTFIGVSATLFIGGLLSKLSERENS
ncbi:MAG: sodium/solute symporter [Ignavibacteriales bacterium]|nr:sodium/solute symporter [Ignavibacteriales bacterium]